ncbi:MAG TPA: monomeric [FeFe] hydrogenase [Kiritimatiellia bacterium]|nr:monomeric [FeFe] hydrogenase [Kiritimatiellia bacterium]HPS07494.1 monomeric [FeFe] hydrogenase [Kiritimatiellia bacterium]
MTLNNESDRVKREVLVRVARDLLAGAPEALDRIPLDMRPKGKPFSRCCVYKDRAALRYRVMAALGFRVEDESDELKPLAAYAAEVPSRTRNPEPFISILAEGCSACLESQTTVTNLCRSCLARPCVGNCPKQAVHIKNGRAEIDRDKCVNCGLCAKACSFHAIVQVPLACADACPVDAVGKSEDGRVVIDHERCIRCGRCQKACPFGAIMACSQLADVILKLKAGRTVIALPAPALAGIFPNDRSQLYGALRALGFAAVYDVASGADETARREAAELAERLAAGDGFVTTSCCPAWTETVKRLLPELARFVSHTPSPMRLAAALARADHPEAVLVFIGPCAAKRTEATLAGDPDHVLTAEELGALLVAAGIDVDGCAPAEAVRAGSRAGLRFAVSGGVAAAVAGRFGPGVAPKPYVINGLSPKMIRLLATFAKTGKAPGQLVEVMCCEGGCTAGPCSFEDPARAVARLNALA